VVQVLWAGRPSCHPTNSVKALKEKTPVAWPHSFFINHLTHDRLTNDKAGHL